MSEILTEQEVKFNALTELRSIQSKLVGLSFLSVLRIMNPSNPLKKEILQFQDDLDDLTDKVGQFIRSAKNDDVDKDFDEPEDTPKEEPIKDEKDIKIKESYDSSVSIV